MGRNILMLFVLCAAGCTEDYDTQRTRLEEFVKGQKIGNSGDYWLVKKSSFDASDDRVALFFGYYDDADACNEVAEALNKKYPRSKFICRPANI